jgi:hypothetical protein
MYDGCAMTDQTVDISPYLSDKQLKPFIEYLDEDDMMSGSFWYELGFIEKYAFDIAVYAGRINGYMDASDSPLYRKEDWPDGVRHRIALQLRDELRREHGLPQLTNDEKRKWLYEHPHKLIGYHIPMPTGLNDIQFTDDHVNRAISYLLENHPDVVVYGAMVIKDNHRRHVIGGEQSHEKYGIRMHFYYEYIKDAIGRTLDDFESLDRDQLYQAKAKVYEQLNIRIHGREC